MCLTVYEKAVGVGFAPADSTAYEKLNPMSEKLYSFGTGK
jgi:hypothetical protein